MTRQGNLRNGVTFRERLLSRIVIDLAGPTSVDDAPCWNWTGAKSPDGYGQVRRTGNRFMIKTHRAVYEMFRGPVPDGRQLDHLCRNRACCNPAHLEIVTQQVNMARGNGIGMRHATRTHCGKGHLFSEENTHQRSDGGRRCRTCQREIDRKRQPRRRPA